MLPSTTDRVPHNTDEEVNLRIEMETAARVAYFEKHPGEIGARLEALDREWDVERVLEANASFLALSGTAMGLLGGRRGPVLAALVAAFLFQHAVQGWCPPLPVLRRLGFRTAREIGRERVALKALRGDFDRLSQPGNRLMAALGAAGLRPFGRAEDHGVGG